MTSSPRSRAAVAAHADWSVDPRKRWITVARSGPDGWAVGAPEPVGDVVTLLDRLRGMANGGAVALGLDLPLGLPRAFAARQHGHVDFPSFLAGLKHRPAFFQVCATLADISRDRPFYPARGLAGMRRMDHAHALGLTHPAQLSRLCDRATSERPAGASLFWTLGPNQSGKAALSAWRDMLLPALDASAPRLWPFHGPMLDLLAPGELVIAETYPAEALRHLGLRIHGSKRRQADRAVLAPGLHAAMRRHRVRPDAAMTIAIDSGFGSDPAGEDRFDSTVGLLCVIGVISGIRADFIPDDPWVRRWEGWVLGQSAVPAT